MLFLKQHQTIDISQSEKYVDMCGENESMIRIQLLLIEANDLNAHHFVVYYLSSEKLPSESHTTAAPTPDETAVAATLFHVSSLTTSMLSSSAGSTAAPSAGVAGVEEEASEAAEAAEAAAIFAVTGTGGAAGHADAGAGSAMR